MAICVVASNRGPVEHRIDAGGTVTEHWSAGGLATMLVGSVGGPGTVWVVATASDGDRLRARMAADSGSLSRHVALTSGTVALRSIVVDEGQYGDYYGLVANETLWFLHHHLFDVVRQPEFGQPFDRAWQAYREVNELFANACAEEVDQDGEVLLQDYHLSLAPSLLRQRRPGVAIAHFTSCPWADPTYFRLLPERVARPLIDGLLGADLLGFMARRWAEAFLGCCRDLGCVVDHAAGRVLAADGRWVYVRVLPVGVDAAELRRRAGEPAFAAERRVLEEVAGGRSLVVRVDRMEPSKNILRGLYAYELLLERRPELRGQVVHYALAYASRSHLADYGRYALEVERQALRINERFGIHGWQPVHLDSAENRCRALAAMSMADVLVVNPVRDGMNLVCKEGPAVSTRDSVLILSREAGAADVMGAGALLINPFDISELATALAEAIAMPPDERRRRAERLRMDAALMPPRDWFETLRRELRAVRPTR